MRGKFVAYYRVSTDTQRKSGVGLDAQRKAVRDYLDRGKWELVGEFTEVETGKRSDRPELAKAIAVCKKHRARLIIAKLDRLSRNLARKQISRRTVEALAAAKARGVKLGNYARISKAKQEAPNAL